MKSLPGGIYAKEVVVYDGSGNLTGNVIRFDSDLAIGTKSLALTLSSGVGQVPIPDTARIVGVMPKDSTTVRIGLEAPEADGAATGTATAAALKKGCPVGVSVMTWFNIGTGSGRNLYLKGGTSDVVEVVVM